MTAHNHLEWMQCTLPSTACKDFCFYGCIIIDTLKQQLWLREIYMCVQSNANQSKLVTLYRSSKARSCVTAWISRGEKVQPAIISRTGWIPSPGLAQIDSVKSWHRCKHPSWLCRRRSVHLRVASNGDASQRTKAWFFMGLCWVSTPPIWYPGHRWCGRIRLQKRILVSKVHIIWNFGSDKSEHSLSVTTGHKSPQQMRQSEYTPGIESGLSSPKGWVHQLWTGKQTNGCFVPSTPSHWGGLGCKSPAL